MDPASIPEVEPRELAPQLNPQNDWKILDVREPFELEIVQLPDSLQIPMQQIPSRIEELNPKQRYAVMCHHGIRSAQVCAYLKSQGFENVWNVRGGIDAWASDVDPNLATY